jgi:hypothetical protein
MAAHVIRRSTAGSFVVTLGTVSAGRGGAPATRLSARSVVNADHLQREERAMPVTVVVGAQWGDEGKAKIIDLLASEHTHVVRYQGGHNAGHTVVVGTEAPRDTDFDPFGDAAARQSEDFDDFAQDEPRPRSSSVVRRDGLTVDLEDSQDDSPPPPPPPRRRRGIDAAIERATDLALRMAGEGKPRREYAKGQRVRHEEYGEGVIAGISGSGPRSSGTAWSGIQAVTHKPEAIGQYC